MQRPTSATVFGILNIVFAAFGVCGLVASVALFSMPQGSDNPVLKIMRENPAYENWIKMSIGIGVVGCVALLVAGIGLLGMKPWARKLTIGYAIYAILFGLLGLVVNYIYLFQPLIEQASHNAGPQAAGALGGTIGGTVGGCFGMIYPILLLIFMTRPKFVAAFNPTPVPQPGSSS